MANCVDTVKVIEGIIGEFIKELEEEMVSAKNCTMHQHAQLRWDLMLERKTAAKIRDRILKVFNLTRKHE